MQEDGISLATEVELMKEARACWRETPVFAGGLEENQEFRKELNDEIHDVYGEQVNDVDVSELAGVLSANDSKVIRQ